LAIAGIDESKTLAEVAKETGIEKRKLEQQSAGADSKGYPNCLIAKALPNGDA